MSAAAFIAEQAAAMKMFAMLGFSQLVRLEDYVKDMQAVPRRRLRPDEHRPSHRRGIRRRRRLTPVINSQFLVLS
jgi:hypothetical protein